MAGRREHRLAIAGCVEAFAAGKAGRARHLVAVRFARRWGALSAPAPGPFTPWSALVIYRSIELTGRGWTRDKIAIVAALPRDLAQLVRAMMIDEFGRGFWVALRKHNDADVNLVLDFLQMIEAEIGGREEGERAPTRH